MFLIEGVPSVLAGRVTWFYQTERRSEVSGILPSLGRIFLQASFDDLYERFWNC